MSLSNSYQKYPSHPQTRSTWKQDEKLNKRVAIPRGGFQMGSGEEEDESPPHRVEVSAFYLQEHEVTHAEYERFDRDHELVEKEEEQPSGPVGRVSWYDAVAYAIWLGGRLPTEAGWVRER